VVRGEFINEFSSLGPVPQKVGGGLPRHTSTPQYVEITKYGSNRSKPMTEMPTGPEGPPTDLVTNLELAFAYSPAEGRLYRTDAQGRIIRELVLWRWDEARGRCVIGSIPVGGRYKMRTHVIFYVMQQRWPLPGLVIDHRDGDPSNNVWSNLREATYSQNNRNADRSSTRWNGRDEVLEQGVTKTRYGTYRVEVLKVQGGSFKSRIEANEVCRQMRRELKGAHDVPFITSRRMIRGTAA
jgi:hypothetical protein